MSKDKSELTLLETGGIVVRVFNIHTLSVRTTLVVRRSPQLREVIDRRLKQHTADDYRITTASTTASAGSYIDALCYVDAYRQLSRWRWYTDVLEVQLAHVRLEPASPLYHQG